MKKTMKKLSLAAMILVLTLSLFGCKKETDCSMCGEVKKCDKYVSTRTDTESYICDDCIQELEDLGMSDLYEKK